MSPLLSAVIPIALAPFDAPRLPPGVNPSEILTVDQIKPGMRGYGLTVFRGTKIERFEVEIVDVVRRGSLLVSGHDMILVRMSGGPITNRKAFLIKGMSGSPIYVKGKLIGAFSQGESGPKEPLGGVTPIMDMLEAWDPKLPVSSPIGETKRDTVTELKKPIRIGSRLIDRVVWGDNVHWIIQSQPHVAVMRPASSYVVVRGLSKTALSRIREVMEPYNVEVMQGAGSGTKPGFSGAPLVPGAAFSMLLSTGDFSFPATGTVTYRKGNRILGFGHPFMNIGAIEAPISSAYIHDVYPLNTASYKISSQGPVAGASIQDRNFSVSGLIGAEPKTIPVSITVNDRSTGRTGVFRSRVVLHPNLTAALVSTAAGVAVTEVRSTPNAAWAKVTTKAEIEGVGAIERTNTMFHQRAIDVAATADLDEILNLCTINPFYPLMLKNVSLTVDVHEGRPTAQIERVFVKEGKFEPGKSIEIGVVIRPFKQEPVTRTITLDIPANTPAGRMSLVVRGGGSGMGSGIGGIILRPSTLTGDQPPPFSPKQMFERLVTRERSTDVVARLLLPGASVTLQGERLPDLPPHLDAILRSPRNSSVRLERDEVRVVMPTEWIVSDQQAIGVNIQRRDAQEGPGPTLQGGGVPAIVREEEFATAQAVRDELGSKTFSTTFALPQDKRVGQRQETNTKSAQALGQTPQLPAGQQPANPGTPTPGTEPPVGRPPLQWKPATQAELLRGELKGVSVTSKGRIIPSAAIERVANLDSPVVWTMISDGQGGVIAGLGGKGTVMLIAKSGAKRVLAELPEVGVHSLLKLDDGSILAGTGPRGRVYRIDSAGKFRTVFEAKEPYCLALAKVAPDRIAAGFGGGRGIVYQLDLAGGGKPWIDTHKQHVLSIATESKGDLWIATAGEGALLHVGRDGAVRSILEAPGQSITSVAVGADGLAYFGSSPRGGISRVSAGGVVEPIVPRLAGAVTQVVRNGNRIAVIAGASVWEALPTGEAYPIDARSDVELTAAAPNDQGSLWLGASNTAEAFRLEYGEKPAPGEYLSPIFDAKTISTWGAVSWRGSPGESVQVFTRGGNTPDPDSAWTSWERLASDPTYARSNRPATRFAQFRVAFRGTVNQSDPYVRDLSLAYLPKNTPPKVTLQSPVGGEVWSRMQSLRWSAADTENDTLQYQVFYSQDEGLTWKQLPSGPTQTSPGVVTSPLQIAGTASPAQSPEDRFKNVPSPLREALIEREKENAQAKQPSPNQPPAPVSPVSNKATTRAFDTSTLPDGRYRFKVVANDLPSNPEDNGQGEAVSEMVIVCNTAPVVALLRDSIKIGPDRCVKFEGVAAQDLIVITAIQVRVDNGDWMAIRAEDGLFDGGLEAFTALTPALSTGNHLLEVKAYNSAGLASTVKREVVVN